MLEKNKVLGQVEILPDGTMFIKEFNQILDDGVVISSVPHRSSYTPDTEIETLPYPLAKEMAQAAWTKEIKEAYAAKKIIK